MLPIKDTIYAALKAADLDAVMQCEYPEVWDRVWHSLPYQSVAYSISMIEYQRAYFRGAGWTLYDASLVLRIDGRPCALWPLSLGGPNGSPRITSAGAVVMAPVFAPGLSPRVVKKICARAIAFMRLLCVEQGLAEPVLEQGPAPGLVTEGASEWHQQLLAAGATVMLRHDLYADLRPALPDIRASVRKSFRPLINVGLRNWSIFVLDQSNVSDTVWAEFKQLHRNVSGRITRNDETWARQNTMLSKGEAFLVGLRDQADRRLVGAGFFQCTRDEGLYAVGAYDRSLFDKPLGHVVQQRAIETMKARGLRWYCLGERHYPQYQPKPTDKEVTIAAFKQGFASNQFCRFEFRLPFANRDAISIAGQV
ncbi:FemAB family protein [Polaromonas sp.]|uniref:FemAB family protein n=1 Tax=Polaromonas sp. TaxID=1869339 RepID=UPI0017CFC867|nr:FemAB family protein [Polaromonas sp.]NML86971.1 FemAB family protein [Polaromonas sp.]